MGCEAHTAWRIDPWPNLSETPQKLRGNHNDPGFVLAARASSGRTGSQLANHCSTFASSSNPQPGWSWTRASAGQMMQLAKRANSAVSNNTFNCPGEGRFQPAGLTAWRYRSRIHNRKRNGKRNRKVDRS